MPQKRFYPLKCTSHPSLPRKPDMELLRKLAKRSGLSHLALLSREGLEEYLRRTGEGCDIYLLEMTLDGNRPTIDPSSTLNQSALPPCNRWGERDTIISTARRSSATEGGRIGDGHHHLLRRCEHQKHHGKKPPVNLTGGFH